MFGCMGVNRNRAQAGFELVYIEVFLLHSFQWHATAVGLDFDTCFTVGQEMRLLVVGPGLTPGFERLYGDPQAHTFKE